MKKINKVVIPIAGFGSRMFPATLGVTKAMLPIVDKPVIQYLVEECVKAGIYEIIIIMSKNQESVKDFLTLGNNKALDKFKDKEEVKKLRDLLNQVSISFMVQTEQKGLGHAILCAKDLVGDEDFGVILGDNPVLARGEEHYGIGQLYDEYREQPGYYIGVKEVEPKETHLYGIVSSDDLSTSPFRLNGMIEKPEGVAPSNYAALGRYILGRSVFDILEKTTPGAGGEIQVTDAIKVAIDNEPVYGTVLKGTCHDTGSRVGFVKANIDFALTRDDIKDGLKDYVNKEMRDYFRFVLK